tara:strand:- start:377 stop:733 length:357 start_codon:yes stop_codon:yes gene_type:complete
MSSLEYDDLYYTATNLEGVNDAYTKLMLKERTVLDAVNSVVQQKELEGMVREGHGSIMDEPLSKLVRDTGSAVMGVWVDLQKGAELKDVFRASRRIYLGIALVAFAILLLLLSKSDGR